MEKDPKTWRKAFTEEGAEFWTESRTAPARVSGTGFSVGGVKVKCFWCGRKTGWQRVHDVCWNEFKRGMLY